MCIRDRANPSTESCKTCPVCTVVPWFLKKSNPNFCNIGLRDCNKAAWLVDNILFIELKAVSLNTFSTSLLATVLIFVGNILYFDNSNLFEKNPAKAPAAIPLYKPWFESSSAKKNPGAYIPVNPPAVAPNKGLVTSCTKALVKLSPTLPSSNPFW